MATYVGFLQAALQIAAPIACISGATAEATAKTKAEAKVLEQTMIGVGIRSDPHSRSLPCLKLAKDMVI